MSLHPSNHTPGGDPDPDEPQSPATVTGGLVSIRSIVRELRRRRRIWLAIAAVGLAMGLALPIVLPLKYSATTILYLSHNPAADPADAMANDVVLVQTEGVAAQAVGRLHLHETATQFLAKYNGTSLSNELLQITATAPSSSEAVRNANAVAAAFLEVRTRQFEHQSAAVQSSLYAPTAPLQKQVAILKNEIGTARHQAATRRRLRRFSAQMSASSPRSPRRSSRTPRRLPVSSLAAPFSNWLRRAPGPT